MRARVACAPPLRSRKRSDVRLVKNQRRASPLWGNANFNRLWAAQILSAFGSRITRTALPIIAVSVLSVSPWEAALLAALT